MADTKQELIKNLSGYSTDILRRLLNYANLIIIPDEDLASNVTMQQLVDKAHSLADVYFPEWTDRSKSDFGEFLVELFAIFSEKDFWYINAFANESILTRMRSYSNAYSKVVSMGYSPRITTPAILTASISVISGDAETISIGGIVISVDGFQFFNNSVINIGSTINSLVTTFVQGIHNVETYTFNGYCIFIRQDNINISTLGVVIDGVEWTRVINFGDADSTSEMFITVPEEDGSVAIYFGSNNVGKVPAIGTSVEVTYDTCDGAKGTVDGSTYALLSSISNRQILSVVPTGASSIGLDPESLASIVANAQMFANNHGTVINEKMGEVLLNSFDFIFQSKIEVSGVSLCYYVVPINGLQAVYKQKEYMQNNFDPRVLMGYTAKFMYTNYINLLTRLNTTKLQVNIYYHKNYDEATIKKQVLQVVQDYTDPHSKAIFGGGFIKSVIDGEIRSTIPGVQKVEFMILNEAGDSYINFSDVELYDIEIFSLIPDSSVELNAYAVN